MDGETESQAPLKLPISNITKTHETNTCASEADESQT